MYIITFTATLIERCLRDAIIKIRNNKNERRWRDVKPKKYANKVGMVLTQEVNIGPKLNKPLPYNPTYRPVPFVVGTSYWLHGSGLFTFVSYVNLLC